MRRARTFALALAVLGSFACSRAPAKPNVLLITVDTWRADRLAIETTPRLSEFAKESLVIQHALTPRAKTTPAIASLMTGLYPHEHGVRELLQPLARGVPVLAERMREGGWSTAAIVGNYVLRDAGSGLARGFEQWTEELPDTQRVPPDNVPERRARSLTDGALVALGLERWKEGEAGPRASFVREDQPWFLWLHYMDPHGSYDPPPEFRSSTARAPDPIDPTALDADKSEPKPFIALYNVPASARMPDGRIDAAAVRALYDGEVRYVDAEIGGLIERLRKAGQLENTLVIVTADHGESLGEQRYWFEHGRNTSMATCEVPLLVHLPAGASGRTRGREEADLSLCDLAPTLLDFLHLPPLAPDARASVRGRARPEILRGEACAPTPVFVEKIERPDLSKAVQHKAVRLGDWKLVRRYAQVFDAATPAKKELLIVGEELYDLAHDPFEEHNLFAAPPATAPLARLQAELVRFASADVHFPDLAQRLLREREQLERSDPEALRILKSLGY